MGPTITEVSAKAQHSKVKSASPVRAVQSKQSEGRSDTKGGQHLARPGAHRGDLTSSSFVSESQPEGFFHAPPCGLALSRLGFPPRITQERCLKPPGLDLIRGWGREVLAPV
jgi:hypothetical protein